jgi:hypothetical protein
MISSSSVYYFIFPSKESLFVLLPLFVSFLMRVQKNKEEEKSKNRRTRREEKDRSKIAESLSLSLFLFLSLSLPFRRVTDALSSRHRY